MTVRLRSTRTGSVVNVDDVTAARLGAEWEPAEAKKEPAPVRKSARARKAEPAKSDADK